MAVADAVVAENARDLALARDQGAALLVRKVVGRCLATRRRRAGAAATSDGSTERGAGAGPRLR